MISILLGLPIQRAPLRGQVSTSLHPPMAGRTIFTAVPRSAYAEVALYTRLLYVTDIVLPIEAYQYSTRQPISLLSSEVREV